MDSPGNSGSLQSSSGGDDEYDSRAAFISGPQISNTPPPFLDPISNYLLLPNSAWPRIRSDTNPILHDHNDIVNSSSSSASFMSTFHPPPPPPPPPPAPTAAPAPSGRNSKKRSRASRRAPTTVLTTDTTNFRAMVQEFTGIPAPPFDSSSFPRNRLDLFAASRSAAASPPPTYLRRPFAQKVQPPIPSPASNPASVSNAYQSSPMNLFHNPFLANFLSPKFQFSDPKPGPFQPPPPNDNPQFGNHLFSPQQTHMDGEQPENNVPGGGGGGGEGMVESWICSSE